MAYKVIFEGRGQLFVFGETSDGIEMQKANAEGWEHPDFYKAQYQIWDFSLTEKIDMDLEDAMVNAKSDNAAFNNFKEMPIAFVATSKSATELCLTYMKYVDQDLIPTKLCTTMEEARDWIGEAASI